MFINRYPVLAEAYVKLPATTGPKVFQARWPKIGLRVRFVPEPYKRD